MVNALYREYGGINCLQPVNTELVDQLMDALGGEDLIRFVSVDFDRRVCEVIYKVGLDIMGLTL